MAEKISLGPRLSCAASFVGKGARVVDVGTDHAYLPVYLMQNRIASAVVASDLTDGPLERAEATLKKYKMTDRVVLHKGNGLEGLRDFRPDTVVICGMGGELIRSILFAADWVRDPEIRLILQPMTRPDVLRRDLVGEGFRILEERLVREDKIYTVLYCRYEGKEQEPDPVRCVIGYAERDLDPFLYDAYLERLKSIYTVRKTGKDAAGEDQSFEELILAEIDKLTNGENGNERTDALSETE